MATYYISRLQDANYKVQRESHIAGVTQPIPMNRVDLERYLRAGHSNPGPLDVLAAVDAGATEMVELDD